eukprot:TRINITY_DN74599_c0_g1_i1.p1 TRINITY_DN74599_c0_g1~~TRINITY_DN74599_c0_g1_i1.p1  ORF type:complete len:246 (+),score=40.55 TRINITY_DN74599_c0_g1_i1:65-739(+)
MLPISRVQVGRDWMDFFTVLVWGTVILIMFLAKLKAAQDVQVVIILSIIMFICNADSIMGRLRVYKIYLVLKSALRKDCLSASGVALGCLVLHGVWPDARAPGVLLHLAAVAAWVTLGVQTSPLVSCGIYLGGRNQMTKTQMFLRVGAQVVGSVLAFAVFGLYFSFRFPGEGPYRHIVSLESLFSALVAFVASVVLVKRQESERMAGAGGAVGKKVGGVGEKDE